VEWTLPAFTPSCRASPHFGWYSFPVLLRAGGSVGLSWLVTEVICPPKDSHPSGGNQTCNHQVASRKSNTLTTRLPAVWLLCESCLSQSAPFCLDAFFNCSSCQASPSHKGHVFLKMHNAMTVSSLHQKYSLQIILPLHHFSWKHMQKMTKSCLDKKAVLSQGSTTWYGALVQKAFT